MDTTEKTLKPKKEKRSPNQIAASPEIVDTVAKPKDDAAPYRVNGRDGEPTPNKESLALKMDDAGVLDASMRPSTLERLKRVVMHPENRKKLGLDRDKVELVTAENVEPFFQGIGLLNVMLGVKVLKLAPEVAGYLAYTPEEKHLLAEATAGAVNENLGKIPKWLLDLLQGGGNVALAKLAMTLFEVHSHKIDLVKQARAQYIAATAGVSAVN